MSQPRPNGPDPSALDFSGYINLSTILVSTSRNMTSDRYLPLKRKREQPVEDTREAGHQASPPQKRLQPTRPKPTPAEFWDNLSEVPLCKRALRELDRRSVQRIVSKPLAQPIQTRQRTEEIKRFARCGGPDIRDLRGVRFVLYRTSWD